MIRPWLLDTVLRFSIAGQWAAALGATLIGTAGSDDKCRWLEDELGFDRLHPYRLPDEYEIRDTLDIGNHHLVSGWRAKLAERIAATTGGRLPGVVFGVGGGEATRGVPCRLTQLGHVVVDVVYGGGGGLGHRQTRKMRNRPIS